jgi:O-antigen/teichoic acid export membrane protein
LVFIYSLVASQHQNKLLKINIVVTIVNIIWNIILIPKYSFMWAGIVTLLSQILLMILWYFATRKLILFHLSFSFIFINILFGVLVYFVWSFLLSSFSVGLYFDFFVFWWLLFFFYSLFLYIILRFYCFKNIHLEV